MDLKAVLHAVSAKLSLALTKGSHGLHIVSAVVDGQVQGDDGVATVDVSTLKGVREVAAACSDIGVIIPVERLTSGGCGVARGGHVHRDGEEFLS